MIVRDRCSRRGNATVSKPEATCIVAASGGWDPKGCQGDRSPSIRLSLARKWLGHQLNRSPVVLMIRLWGALPGRCSEPELPVIGKRFTSEWPLGPNTPDSSVQAFTTSPNRLDRNPSVAYKDGVMSLVYVFAASTVSVDAPPERGRLLV